MNKKESSVRFADLPLSGKLIDVLTKREFTTPTPIQEQAIPVVLEGKDVIGIAQTGTGKTLAFTLPMLQTLSEQKGLGLVIVPTRELALQVQEEIDRIGHPLGFHTALLIGGANIDRQIRALRKRPQIIIATPGRIIDHLDRRTVRLDNVRMLVLDEADRMLDMGFTPQINQILETVPDERQTLLFSATMPEGVTKIAHGYMTNPERIEVAPPGTSAKNIDQSMCYVKQDQKLDLLTQLLEAYSQGPVLVFCRTKYGTRNMARTLSKSGYRSEELHSNRSLNQRRFALENFKRGKSRVMVATDVAARGIDVKEIALVVNYDLPDQHEDYVHRIGRTGRAGHEGHAISFAAPNQHRDVKSIEKIIGRSIPLLNTEFTLTEEELHRLFEKNENRGRKNGRRNNRGGSQRNSRGRSRNDRNSQGRSGRREKDDRRDSFFDDYSGERRGRRDKHARRDSFETHEPRHPQKRSHFEDNSFNRSERGFNKRGSSQRNRNDERSDSREYGKKTYGRKKTGQSGYSSYGDSQDSRGRSSRPSNGRNSGRNSSKRNYGAPSRGKSRSFGKSSRGRNQR